MKSVIISLLIGYIISRLEVWVYADRLDRICVMAVFSIITLMSIWWLEEVLYKKIKRVTKLKRIIKKLTKER